MSKRGPASRAAEILVERLAAAGESQNAYSERRGISQGRLSRVIRGETECALDLAIQIRDDWMIPVEYWTQAATGETGSAAA